MKKTFVITASVMLLAAGCARSSAVSQPSHPQADDAAREGLETLKQLITNQNYRSMGFDNLAEVSTAVVGPEWKVSTVHLDRLKSYTVGADPSTLLTPSNETIYPVLVGNSVRSSISVSQAPGGYRASGFGKAPVIKELAKYHTGSSVVIWIPALNLYYVGEGSGPNLRLTPIADDSRLQLRAGVAASAREVFNQLVPIANNLKPQFPT